MFGIFGLKKKKTTPKEPERRYFSDILLNDPPESEWRVGRKVLDYTSNPERLLEDMKSFENKQLIKICGNIAGLCVKIEREKYFEQRLEYDGMIILGVDFPLYFSASKSRKEVRNLELEKLMLESAKSFPIFMTGRFYHEFTNGYGTGIPFHIRPDVLQIGDYISPQPRKGLAENE